MRGFPSAMISESSEKEAMLRLANDLSCASWHRLPSWKGILHRLSGPTQEFLMARRIFASLSSVIFIQASPSTTATIAALNVARIKSSPQEARPSAKLVRLTTWIRRRRKPKAPKATPTIAETRREDWTRGCAGGSHCITRSAFSRG